jgi:RNA polymerase subunit RPABC4/transcription elongation factor Spt4
MNMEKKECLACKEFIHEKATKCPHCHQIQSKFYTTQYNKWFQILLLLFLGGIIVFLFNDTYRVIGGQNKTPSLNIETENLYTRTVSGRDFVSCSGIIVNKSDRDASDIYLRADFYNEKNELIDTFATKTNLRIKHGEKSNYRTRDEADKSLVQYKSCKVSVIDKWMN